MLAFGGGLIAGILLGFLASCLFLSGRMEDAWREGYHAGQEGGRDA